MTLSAQPDRSAGSGSPASSHDHVACHGTEVPNEFLGANGGGYSSEAGSTPMLPASLLA